MARLSETRNKFSLTRAASWKLRRGKKISIISFTHLWRNALCFRYYLPPIAALFALLAPVAAGNLKAVGYNDGKPVATNELHAAGPAAKIALAADPGANLPHDYDDVATVQVTITDTAGNPVVSATPEVHFAITGPGAIAAIDNGAADNHASFQGNQVHAAGGQCTAYIRSTADSGTITVTATAENLASGIVTLIAQPPKKK